MNFIDILIIAVLIAFLVKGFMKGLVREVSSLLGLITGAWAAFKYYPFTATVIRPYIHLPFNVAAVLSFVLIFLLIGLLFFFLGHLFTVVFKIALLGGVNRVGGVVFGFLQGSLILCILLALAVSRPVPEMVRVKIQGSPTAGLFIPCGKEIVAGWESEARPRPGADSPAR